MYLSIVKNAMLQKLLKCNEFFSIIDDKGWTISKFNFCKKNVYNLF